MQLNFPPETVKPAMPGDSGEIWPLAKYKVEIVAEETKPSSSNPHNAYVELTLRCLEGPFTGKTHPMRLHLITVDPIPLRIAQQTLSAIAWVTERIKMTDTAHLVGAKLIAEIGPQKPPNQDKYSEVKEVFHLDGRTPQEVMSGKPAPAPSPIPAYAQPGPVPTVAAPAAPQGGWQPSPAAPAAPQWSTVGGPPPAPAQPLPSAPPAQQPPPTPSQPWTAPTQPAQAAPAPQPNGWQQGAVPAAAVPPWGTP